MANKKKASKSRNAASLGLAEIARVESLYEQPLPSSRAGALYNAFSYPTKISPEAIALFISTHPKPGATVLDAFGGSGTTGLAALLCDRPTDTMLQMASDMRAKPEWGPRIAHVFEIGTLGSFVAKTLCAPPSPEVFAKAVEKLCSQAQKKIGWIYSAKNETHTDGEIRHVIWSDILVCPNCGKETSYWDAVVKHAPLSLAESFICPSCAKRTKVDACERAFESVPDFYEGFVERKKRVVTRIYGTTGKSKWQRKPTKDDLKLVKSIDQMQLPPDAPNSDLVWGDLYRAGYHKGITKLHHFYTRRNFLAIATLWEMAGEFPVNVRDALRLLVLSYNSAHATLMTRVVVKNGQNDLVLTGAQSGVLYISGLPVEKNVIKGVVRKAKSFKDAFALVHKSKSKVWVHNSSSESMGLRDASIDYVFTDPPFGAYIPYAEINQINEIWLGSTTDRSKEIVISEAQGKGVDEYGKMMGNVFKELARVLKPDGMATVVFHSAHSQVWRALVAAYTGAGLSVRATSVLDKIQVSFKQVVSQVSVKGDPLLLLTKKKDSARTRQTCRGVADEIVSGVADLSVSERAPQRLYSRFVSRCLELGMDVGIDAKDFYALARAQAGEPT